MSKTKMEVIFVVLILLMIGFLGMLSYFSYDDSRFEELKSSASELRSSLIGISILDLYSTTWDINSSRLIGGYKGRIVRANQFEVYTWYEESENRFEKVCGGKVEFCCKMGNWMLIDEKDGSYYLSSFHGTLKVLDEEGNVLVTLK